MSRARRVVSAATGGVLALGTLSACAQASPFTTVKDFLVAWQVENYDAAAKHTTGDRKVVHDALEGLSTQLDAADLKLRLKAERTSGVPEDKGRIDRQDDKATARFQVNIDLGENGRAWSYQGQLDLRRIDNDWKILWSPSVLHPALGEGDRLAVITENKPRAEIKDFKGRSLMKAVKTDLFGVVPRAVKNIDATVEAIAKITEQDELRLKGRILSAPPASFLQLAAAEQGSTMSNQLSVVPGVERRTRDLPIQSTQAKELIGSVGPATSELLTRVGAPYQPGDTVGQSGLQLLFQRRLAGLPVVKIVVLGKDGVTRKTIADFSEEDATDQGGTSQSRPAEENGDAFQPRTIRTTLDRTIQYRAENALRKLNLPASIVTVKTQTGEIVAAANHNTEGRNRALEGAYSPGTTFAPIMAAPLFASGALQLGQQPCLATSNVGGQDFTASPARPKATVSLNFATGCKTALAGLGSLLDDKAYQSSLQTFGLNASWGLSGVQHNGAELKTPATAAERAQMVVGESGVQVSPLTMALVASAIQSGTWRAPQLLLEPAPADQLVPRPLDVETYKGLDDLMRTGIRSGSARAAAAGGFKGGLAATVTDAQGKTISWFVGYRQDYGVAIAVEGSLNAAQLATAFIKAKGTPPPVETMAPGGVTQQQPPA